ncbi:putative reverse transcriptase domain-containing protein [Tanacetum coccineum]
MYETRQTTIPFPSRLNGYYCEEMKGSYRPQFSEAYFEASQSIPQKEKDPGSFTLPCFINNVCFDNSLVDLGASISVMPLLAYLNLGLGELAHTKLTVELADRTVKYPKRITKNVLVGISKFTFLIDFIILDMPEDIKVPLILGRPFLSIARPEIDVYKRKITLRVIEEFRTRDDELDIVIDYYPSYCDCDKKIHIDYAHNLKFSCMIGFEFTHANFFPLLYVNVMSKKFHNSIIKEKMVYNGNNVVGALMNIPIFVGTFSMMTDFAVLENMDAYRDDGMGDVIFGEPFLREVGIKTKRFEGMITIYNGNDEVTYQMVRSHPRFKRHTNEQCNKIPPLLKVSKKDEVNGISHAYQKLKGFYKGVLNLGPDYIRDAKTEEWLTRRHISVHEME